MWLHFGLAQKVFFLTGLEIDHFGNLGGPREGQETLQKGGERRPPTFWRVSKTPGAAQIPKMTHVRPLKQVEIPAKVQPRKRPRKRLRIWSESLDFVPDLGLKLARPKPSPIYPARYPQIGTQQFRTILGRFRCVSTMIRNF